MDLTQPDMTNPVDRMAHYLSELDNDNAPIGWQRYRSMASIIINKFDLEAAVMAANI